MSLQLQLAPAKLKFLQNITYFQRLGEILHFSVSHLLMEFLGISEKPDLEILLNKALAYYPEPLSEREKLKLQAKEILEKMLKSESWETLITLLKGAKALYREPEAYSSRHAALLRPDFLIERENEWVLLEFKLREEDFNPHQMEKYLELLQDLDKDKKIVAYFVSLEPFELKPYRICPEKNTYEKQSLSHTTQLSLFKELG